MNIELIEEKKDERLFRIVTYHRHSKPIGKHRIAHMIAHKPYDVVSSCSPFAHLARTERELQSLIRWRRRGTYVRLDIPGRFWHYAAEV